MKKFKAAFLVSFGVMMAAGAQSAFATSGQYDGPATANPVNTSQFYAGYINAASDSDWYVINNATSSSTSPFFPRLVSPLNINLDAQIIWMHKDGDVDITTYSNAGAGGTETMGGYAVGAGDTMYIRVFPHSSTDISSTSQYLLLFQ